MTEPADEAEQQAYKQGFGIGVDMAPAMVLQVLLRHVLSQAADPDALREELRAEALGRARAINDGTGNTSILVDGVRAGAADRIESLFGSEKRSRRQ